ncbi:hypothetical protein FOZ63_025331 [Perkinsus olseni]|uniref:Peptidase A2 domain-containing protein n=1 Tax=Perkinsus olseni TaxID=32597 RepID=A0A7J6SYW2_PEROL|nr:hypothetical protein FOZ63_025331 [Perkinsus olseni]
MYAEGREDEFVLRRVSLWVGKRKVENIEIGLMVGSTRIENGAQPLAMLGPAHLTHETDAEVDTPSLIGQLVNAGVISQAAFSVHASELYVGINGRLVLGEDLRKTRNLTFFPLTTASWTKSPSAIAASAVRVWVPSAEDEMMEFSHEPQDRLELIIDTGADATVVPKKVFSMIWEALEWELGDDRTANRSELFHSIQLDEVDAFVDINGWIWFHTSVMDYLPVIAIDVDTDSTLEMHLSQHVQVCKGEWCRLLVTDKLPFDKAVDVFILGCPFFTEHDVHVDFNRGVAGFAAPEEPVVNTITSLETWNRIHRPLCRRRP